MGFCSELPNGWDVRQDSTGFPCVDAVHVHFLLFHKSVWINSCLIWKPGEILHSSFCIIRPKTPCTALLYIGHICYINLRLLYRQKTFLTQVENNSRVSSHCHIFFWNSMRPIHMCDAAFGKMSLLQYHNISFGKFSSITIALWCIVPQLPRALAHGESSGVPDTHPQPRANSLPQISCSAVFNDYEQFWTLPRISGIPRGLCRLVLFCAVSYPHQAIVSKSLSSLHWPLVIDFALSFLYFFHLVSLQGHWEHCVTSLNPHRMRSVWRGLKL